jgi:hypothetical protein
MHVDMHVVYSTFKSKSGKTYKTILLRESYREGKKVKKRTIANLSRCTPEEIKAITLALKHKKDLTHLQAIQEIEISEGLSVGSVWAVFQTAKQLGITKALGKGREGQLALWQIIARVLERGSRLSAVRLNEIYAMADVIGLERRLNEEDLYRNLTWLANNQEKIEDVLFKQKSQVTDLFLYDVTSSYLEGDKNELSDYGYNRDKKRGKKQIVIGLLCDKNGNPVSIEVFKGNTQDTTTMKSQIEKIKTRFRCKKISFVGDRGMIKSGQIEQLQKHGFYYITAITKKEIETLIKRDVVQYEIFDETVSEIVEGNIRYILRRNPIRAKEQKDIKKQKKTIIEEYAKEQNEYLTSHKRAKVKTAIKRIQIKINKLKTDKWITIEAKKRTILTIVDEKKLQELSRLDGCYIIKTNLVNEVDKETVHNRYKDLAFVESAFRTCKTNLDIRPVYVRKAKNTKGHIFIVMLAYKIIRELNNKWSNLYLTVEEGLRRLSNIIMLEITIR